MPTKQKKKTRRGFLPKKATHGAVMSAALLFWKELDTPRSLGLYLRAKYGLWQEIAEARIFPIEYNSADGFRRDYAAISFLRKYPKLPIHVDRKANAVVKFREAENSCAQTNERMRLWKCRVLKPLDPRFDAVMYRAKSKITNLLSVLDLDEISRMMRWGPGATSATKGAHVSAYNKFDAAPECTLSSLRHGWASVNSVPTWAQAVAGAEYPCSVLPSAFRVVPGNRLTFVPKDALIDRMIGIEPHMNIWVQLGFGGAIRRRLKHKGIDLSDQSLNAEAARLGSREGHLATIDLSSASDTIAHELVEFLLPDHWYWHLCKLRSPSGTLDGSTVVYEKFSSMGNGFTFELETLIFWSLSVALLEELSLSTEAVCVYGDDIIIPVEAYQAFVSLLDFVGFKTNERKSFCTTPFRESCGAHYWDGQDVTPVFCDQEYKNALSWFGLINQITAFERRSQGSFDFSRVKDCLLSIVDKRDLFFGPPGFGDGYVHSYPTVHGSVRVFRSKGNWVESFWFRHFVPVQRKYQAQSPAALTWALFKLEREFFPTSIPALASTVYVDKGIKHAVKHVSTLVPTDSTYVACKGMYPGRKEVERLKVAKLEFWDWNHEISVE